jgi:hypothetical protein
MIRLTVSAISEDDLGAVRDVLLSGYLVKGRGWPHLKKPWRATLALVTLLRSKSPAHMIPCSQTRGPFALSAN